MQLLSLAKLKNYNLFSDSNNNLILKALFISENEIKIFLKNKLPQNPLIQIYNQFLEQVFEFNIRFFSEENTILLTGKFKLNENYILKINNTEQANVIFNPKIGGILDNHFFSKDTDFGVHFSDTEIHFKLWSPPAVQIELLLYDENQNPVKTDYPLYAKNTKSGIWELTVNLKYENYFYQYKISAYGKKHIALDPYAKSMALFDPNSEDKTGKAAIVNLKSEKANPPDFKRNYSNFKFMADENDLIAYELNVRDFTIQPGIVEKNTAGTFKGFIEKINYLKELGITHVQLMPVNKGFTQIETDRTYTGKSAKKSNYNWGYDPMNYFTLEGRYSTNPYNPYTRIYEFKELIQALHNAGIGVILDVVFNHTYSANTFENIAPGCYYRLNDDFTISGHTGAGASVESRRKQVRKFIIDVLKFYVSEYHIDGFRFDLMSFTDKDTMKQIRNEVGRIYNSKNPNELILQGEAWNFTDLKKEAFVKTDFNSLNIGIFNDTFRDSLAGNGKNQGFIQDNTATSSALASAIIGGTKSYDNNNCIPFNKDIFFNPYNLFAEEPNDCLNFLSVHDGLTLWDKINLTIKDPSKKERLQLMKLAYAILLTSQGKMILHGGDEILRTKPLADFDKEKHRALTSQNIDKEENSVYFHENSYCSNDYTNMFRWDRLTNDYSEYAKELLSYVKELIKLRRSISAFRFNTAQDINNHIRFLDANCIKKNHINSFKSFKLGKLALKFINGTPEETLFMTGEIHKNEANPSVNPYILYFDKNGKAEINFNTKEIRNFDLQKWDTSRNLNFKLVKTPGKWDFSEKSYSNFGNNSISPESLNENFECTVNLNIKDYKSIKNSYYTDKHYIAYIIEQKEKKNTHISDYNNIIVIHNGSSETLHLESEEFSDLRSLQIFPKNQYTEIKIKDGKISVPRKSSAIIANK